MRSLLDRIRRLFRREPPLRHTHSLFRDSAARMFLGRLGGGVSVREMTEEELRAPRGDEAAPSWLDSPRAWRAWRARR